MPAHLLLLLLAVLPQDGAIAAPASELKVVKSQGRFWTHADGYIAVGVAGEETVTAELALPRALPPGMYYFFLKGTGGAMSVRLSCGGGSAPDVRPDDRDANGLWTDALRVDVKAAAQAVGLTFTLAEKAVERAHYQFQALYVTSRGDVAVDRTDHLVVRSADAPRDPAPPPAKGNLVPNGSFEVGLGHGWDLAGPSDGRDYSIRSLWRETGGAQGAGCVRLPPGATLMSRVLGVRRDRPHTLSVSVRSDGPASTLTLLLQDAHGIAAPVKKTFPAGAAWERVSLSAPLPGEVQIHLAAGLSAVQIDQVQLEEGGLGEFAAKDPVEVGLVIDAPAHLFFEDEKVVGRLRVRNEAEKAVSTRLAFEIYDYLNRKVKDGAVDVEVPPRAAAARDLDLSPGRRGIFRVVLWAEGSEEEVAYAVVPRPQIAGPDPASMIGVHADASDYQYEVLRKLGIHWTRILSPEAWFRWNRVEPERGRRVWQDERARKTRAQGFEILGTIGPTEWPKWAYRDGKPDLDAWEEFVFRTVEHYKPWLKHWEVWNEPVHEFTAVAYAEILRRAARAIRKADPEAKIVGLGGSFSVDWCVDVIRELGGKPSDHFDVASTHVYPDRADPLNPLKDTQAAGFAEKILRPYGMEVWNTEAGAWCLGFHQGPNSGFRTTGPSLWPHADGWRYYRGGDYEASRVARNFLHSVGNGFSRYFYYDSRFHAAQSAGQSHCTLFGLGDTIRAKGVAYAVLARLFDHSKGLGNVSSSKDSFAYLFDRGGVPVAAVFMADVADVTNRKRLPPGKWKAFDLMGNPLDPVVFGRQPVYLEGRDGISVEEMRAALRSGVPSDVPDTTPPQVSLGEGPRGTIRPQSVRLRWIAIDEVSIPGDPSSRHSILYSFRLEGRDREWSAWTPEVYADYADLPVGRYRFEVRAKDASGNVSPPAVREFLVAPL